MVIDLAALPDDADALRANVLAQAASLADQRGLIERLRLQLARLRRVERTAINVRPFVGAAGDRGQPAGAGARGAGDGGAHTGTRQGSHGYRGQVGVPQTCQAAAAGAPAARGGAARRRCAGLRGLWRHAAPSRRGRDRGAGRAAGPVPGHPACPAEVLLPRLRFEALPRTAHRLRRRACRSAAAGPRLGCSPMSWWPSTPTTCRSIGRARSTPGRASTCSA